MHFNYVKVLASLLAFGVSISHIQCAPTSIELARRDDERSLLHERAFRFVPYKPPRPKGGPPRPPVISAPGPARPPLGNTGSGPVKIPKNFDDTVYVTKVEKLEGHGDVYHVFRRDSEAMKSNPKTDKTDGDAVDRIGVQKDQNVLTVYEAENAADGTTAGKLSFTEVQMAVWNQAGKIPSDLKEVRYQDVQNDLAKESIAKARKQLGQQEFILKSSDTDNKKALFDELVTATKQRDEAGNVIGGGNELTGSLQSILRDYNVGKKPTEIKVFEDKSWGGVTVMDVILEKVKKVKKEKDANIADII